jgi:hypothetical protein
MIYQVLLCHVKNRKQEFLVYDWIEKRPESKEDLLELISKHLRSRSIVGYKIKKVFPIKRSR